MSRKSLVIAFGALAVLTVVLTSLAQPKGSEEPKEEVNKGFTVTGEVVDLWCFLNKENGRGAGHKQCAVMCAKGGTTIAIVDSENQIFVVMGAKDMQPAAAIFLDRMADTVTVTGTLFRKGGTQVLFVRSVK